MRWWRKFKAQVQGIPPDPSDAFADDLQGISRDAGNMCEKVRKQEGHWRLVYFMLGLPSAILAALAGATALASTSGRVPAGIVALVSAGAGAALNFLDPRSREKSAAEIAAGWDAVKVDAERFYDYERGDPQWVGANAENQVDLLKKRARKLRVGTLPDYADFVVRRAATPESTQVVQPAPSLLGVVAKP